MDRRLIQIQHLDDKIGRLALINDDPAPGLHAIRQMLTLLDEGGFGDARVTRAYYDAFQIAISQGDVPRAREFARMAYETRSVVEGEDSPTTQKCKNLSEDPRIHPLFSESGQKVSAHSAPGDRDHDEDWLWMSRERLCSSDGSDDDSSPDDTNRSRSFDSCSTEGIRRALLMSLVGDW